MPTPPNQNHRVYQEEIHSGSFNHSEVNPPSILTPSANLLYSTNNSPTSPIVSSSTEHSINLLFSGASFPSLGRVESMFKSGNAVSGGRGSGDGDLESGSGAEGDSALDDEGDAPCRK